MIFTMMQKTHPHPSCLLNLICFLFSPGEFTLRAFLNGRLDLSQAESVSTLVSAKSVAAADAALAGIQECIVLALKLFLTYSC